MEYTRGQHNWLRENMAKYNVRELTRLFAEQFPEHPVTEDAIRMKVKNLGGACGTLRHQFSSREDAWLLKYCPPKGATDAITDRFNRCFNLSVSRGSLTGRIRRLSLAKANAEAKQRPPKDQLMPGDIVRSRHGTMTVTCVSSTGYLYGIGKNKKGEMTSFECMPATDWVFCKREQDWEGQEPPIHAKTARQIWGIEKKEENAG